MRPNDDEQRQAFRDAWCATVDAMAAEQKRLQAKLDEVTQDRDTLYKLVREREEGERISHQQAVVAMNEVAELRARLAKGAKETRILMNALVAIVANSDPDTVGTFCDQDDNDTVHSLREHYAAHLRAIQANAKSALARVLAPPS